MQRQADGIYHPIAFGGHACTPAMKHYSSAQLEICALAAALRSMEPYFLQQKVTVLTDNCSCLYFHKLQFGTAREKRIAVYLAQFNLNIRYIRGAKNMCADALSRCFDRFTEEEKNVFMPDSNVEDFIFKLQQPRSDQGEDNVDSGVLPGTPIVSAALQSVEGALVGNKSQASALRQRRLRRASAGDAEGGERPLAAEESSAAAAVEAGQQSNKSLVHLLPQDESASGDVKDLMQISIDTEADENNNEDVAITLPDITEQDYKSDAEFSAMWEYLLTGSLTHKDDIDRRTMLMADQFFIEEGKLYKLELPRNKKLQRVLPLTHRLCVPQAFREAILHIYHDVLGHCGKRRFLLALMSKFYWRSLYTDAQKHVTVCDVCQKSKINYAKRTAPLHPLEAEDLPFSAWSLDFKPLYRTTKCGSTVLLCMVDVFSKFPVVVGLPDAGAKSAAKAFVNHIICHYGIPQRIYTDSGSSFTAKFFKEVSNILNIKHHISAVKSARTNSVAELLVKAVSQGLKFYDKDDVNMEDILSLVLMSLRASAHSKLQISPFEILYGRPMPIGKELQHMEFATQFKGDPKSYYEFIKGRLAEIYEGIRKNISEAKLEDEKAYNKRHKVVPPSWFVGQRVLVEEARPDTKNNRILTHRPFGGPYIITGIVQENRCGPAYRLVNEETGKPCKRLIAQHRLKQFITDPQAVVEPDTKEVALDDIVQSPKTDTSEQTTMVEATCILKQAGKGNYLVLFPDGQKQWSTKVSEGLLRDWRLRQDDERLKRRLKRQQ